MPKFPKLVRNILRHSLRGGSGQSSLCWTGTEESFLTLSWYLEYGLKKVQRETEMGKKYF